MSSIAVSNRGYRGLGFRVSGYSLGSALPLLGSGGNAILHEIPTLPKP